MKKALLALVFISLLLPMTCLATGEENQEEQIPPELQRLLDIIYRIEDVVTILLFTLAGFFALLAGFFFATASGNPGMVGLAKKMLLFALIGVVVGALAHFLVELVEWLVEPPPPPQDQT